MIEGFPVARKHHIYESFGERLAHRQRALLTTIDAFLKGVAIG